MRLAVAGAAVLDHLGRPLAALPAERAALVDRVQRIEKRHRSLERRAASERTLTEARDDRDLGTCMLDQLDA